MIKEHAPAAIRANLTLAKKVIKHHFGKLPRKLEFKPAGKTNFVFEAVMGKSKKYIVRIAAIKDKLLNFQKEEWVINKVSEKNIPVAKVVEVGADIIPFPYMIQEKLNGEEAIHHENRLDILFEMGAYTKLIHSIPTTSFGHVFDWSEDNKGKNKTWKDFLQNEWNVVHRIEFLDQHHLVDPKKMKKLQLGVSRIEKWKESPSLNHGDIRLKNIIVNTKGKILAFIDWENCLSAITPCWDLSIALHDLSVDAKQRFLEGYGMKPEEYEQHSQAIKFFNILNYVPTLEELIGKNKKLLLGMYRLRLNGMLDLYSI